MRTSDWEGVWSRGLIVSCQPVVAGPLDRDDIVLAMAQAAAASGASAVRIEGVQRVALVARSLAIPVVGIVKRPVPGSPVFITPVAEDVRALAAAGAAVVAFDATLERIGVDGPAAGSRPRWWGIDGPTGAVLAAHVVLEISHTTAVRPERN